VPRAQQALPPNLAARLWCHRFRALFDRDDYRGTPNRPGKQYHGGGKTAAIRPSLHDSRIEARTKATESTEAFDATFRRQRRAASGTISPSPPHLHRPGGRSPSLKIASARPDAVRSTMFGFARIPSRTCAMSADRVSMSVGVFYRQIVQFHHRRGVPGHPTLDSGRPDLRFTCGQISSLRVTALRCPRRQTVLLAVWRNRGLTCTWRGFPP